jgi:hypothetical protein
MAVSEAPGILARAHHFVTACGFNVAAIDAPGHGDRPRTAADQQQVAALRQEGADPVNHVTAACPGRTTAPGGDGELVAVPADLAHGLRDRRWSRLVPWEVTFAPFPAAAAVITPGLTTTMDP